MVEKDSENIPYEESHDEEHHDSFLPHHYESREQHIESSKFGMWLFLATEIMLFSGLFVAYSVYRSNHPQIFLYAHKYLNSTLGGINTVVLICSSLTMAWAVRCAQLGQKKGLLITLTLTLIFAFMFMGVKYIEYQDKWKHGLLWGDKYQPQHHVENQHSDTVLENEKLDAGETGQDSESAGIPPEERTLIEPARQGPGGLSPEAYGESASEINVEEPRNVHIFFGIYFMMTGLHGIHVLAGIIAIIWLIIRGSQGVFHSRNFLPVDMIGLYWHLVDLIWIFLFPLLYLIE